MTNNYIRTAFQKALPWAFLLYLRFMERKKTGEWHETKIYTFSPFDMTKYTSGEKTVFRNLENFLRDNKLPTLDDNITQIIRFLTKDIP